jgi:hypothetical protein
MFAKFAKFAKFANIDSALEHPTLIHHHPPRLGTISERASPTQNPPSPVFDGPGTLWVAGKGGEGRPGQGGEGER